MKRVLVSAVSVVLFLAACGPGADDPDAGDAGAAALASDAGTSDAGSVFDGGLHINLPDGGYGPCCTLPGLTRACGPICLVDAG